MNLTDVFWAAVVAWAGWIAAPFILLIAIALLACAFQVVRIYWQELNEMFRR